MMTNDQLKQIFLDTDYPHTSGTPEELKTAEYLKERGEALGVEAKLESFPVAMAEMVACSVSADGEEIPCKAFYCCGTGEVEGELYYMPALDPVSMAGAKDKIVLLDTQGIGFYGYQDLIRAGARGILFQYGNMHYPNTDIDQRDLRQAVVGDERKLLCAMIHSASAVDLVRRKISRVRIAVRQKEYDGESHNVVAEIKGRRDEFITLTAHYDSTSLSHGAYDNMSGCAGLLGVMEALKDFKLNYGLRFVFCGSEERGLLGSKAYVRDHEAELEKTVLNINLDMIGSIMGKFIACASAEDKLAHYLSYMGAELGFPVAARTGVYSSDSTPFADKGVPAVSLARLAGGNVAAIHCRYDLMDVLSMEQLSKDIAFIAEFTRRMSQATCCPVAREIPDSIKKELDEYLFRKRKNEA
ncbi:MAG: M28 family peptidase [Clostridia bacterium]|nr:M28 family peptidase [Clostridia bacterium]